MNIRSAFFIFVFILAQHMLSQDSIKIENNFYALVTIGNSTWQAQNLNVSYFANDDPIPYADYFTSFVDAGKKHKPAWCWYKTDTSNAYGKLYNWYAVHDKRGIAPKGWHVASTQEWDTLISIVTMMSLSVKSKYDWTVSHDWPRGGNGTNSSGFNALPAGSVLGEECKYVGLHGGGAYSTGGYPLYERGNATSFWSSTSNNKKTAWDYHLEYSSEKIYPHYANKCTGFSVRLVKD
jgi:uncharacterized protein (TIGR02145 family)